MKTADCIVAGVGGVGSAALYHLARRGVGALGIDRHPPVHNLGSSHGQSRIIRLVYLEHPDYVPLLHRAYQLWDELGNQAGQKLYHQTGLLYAGAATSGAIPAILDCARQHDLSVERLRPETVRRRFPGFHLPEQMTAVFEKGAGYLKVEDCVRAHIDEAQKLGAELHSGETVLSWKQDGDTITVTTDKDVYQTRHLILAPGAWAPELLQEIGVDFEIRRKETFWFEANQEIYTLEGGCPTFVIETRASLFYGIPAAGTGELKIAEHSGGQPISDPSRVDRDQNPEDRRSIDVFLSQYLPFLGRKLVRHSVCMYTMTSDENFIVDGHPRSDRVFFAAGLSGHGFKFSGVLGEALAGRVAGEPVPENMRFLGLKRAGIQAI